MAVSSEARARRYEWRAEYLRSEGDDTNAAVLDRAAMLIRQVDAARSAFQEATALAAAEQAEALAAWYRSDRTGDKPIPDASASVHPDITAFRAASAAWSELFHSDEYRGAAGRFRLTVEFDEPSDADLLGANHGS